MFKIKEKMPKFGIFLKKITDFLDFFKKGY